MRPKTAFKDPGTWLLVVALSSLLLGFVAWELEHSPRSHETTRHTVTDVVALVPFRSPPDDIWIRVTFERAIWIRPDGSGRIVESVKSVKFPTESEHHQWLTAHLPAYTGINESFETGELLYVPAEALRSQVDQLGASGESPGEFLKRLSSLLTETVPSRDLIAEALRRVDLPGISTVREDSTVTVSGVTSGPAPIRVALTIDRSMGRVARETRTTLVQLGGLDLQPPIIMLDRQMVRSEVLESWGSSP